MDRNPSQITAPEKSDSGGSSSSQRTTAEHLSNQVRFVADAFHLAIPPAELCGKLRSALDRAAARDAESMEELHAAVREYTDLLRDEGTTPEGVLISLKTVINLHSLPPSVPDPDDHSQYRLRERVISWAIEEYFGAEK